MTSCNVDQIIRAKPMAEGAGVVVHRTIGTQSLRNLDPFLMLDHFGSDNPNEYIAGFPDHPHRGFITLTYMLDGHMLHEDSMGNRGDLSAGGVQWMKAASGVIHSEMPQQTDGLMRGFQLWINLPAKQKMSEPGYQEFSAAAIPTLEITGGTVKIICGRIAEIEGPIKDSNTDVFYYDLCINPHQVMNITTDSSHQMFAYCYDGSAEVQESQGQGSEGQGAGKPAPVPTHSLVTFTRGDSLSIAGGSEGANLILVGGKPINEEIVQYGPFVMNTPAEIETAIADFHAGKLVQKKAAFVTDSA